MWVFSKAFEIYGSPRLMYLAESETLQVNLLPLRAPGGQDAVSVAFVHKIQVQMLSLHMLGSDPEARSCRQGQKIRDLNSQTK